MKKNLFFVMVAFFLFSQISLAKEEFHFKLPNYSFHKLDNGFELILVENHANPMIASVIVVKTGLRNETVENNGVSHMLEHMTFNGTDRRTQKELYDELDFQGIYLNAQTSEDFTTYMALNHKDHITDALDIMSDMLLHSTFPAKKFEKEKGIIVEEIGKDSESPDFKAELKLREAFYKKPPYSLPVIGTVETVQQMSREMVLDYYHHFYRPNNMIAIVIGDFNQKEMLQLFSRYFGEVKAGNTPNQKIDYHWKFPFVFTRKAAEEQQIFLRLPAPTFYSDYFSSFRYFYKIALEDENSLILKNLKNNPNLGISKIESGYEFHPEFAFLTLKINAGPEADAGLIKKSVLEQFTNFDTDQITETEIKVIRQEEAISQTLQTDKILYYGFLKAQELAVGGVNAFAKMTPEFLETKQESIQYFAGKYPNFWPDDQALFLAGNWSQKLNLRQYQKSARKVKTGNNRLFKKVLANGLTAILLQNKDSEIFAMHFLFKNRSAWEPAGKTGIADFLHHILFKQSRNYSEQKMQFTLKEIGAEVKAYDWDFIPYDDYYNVPQFSYLRFVTLDQFFEDAIKVAADNILFPDIGYSFTRVKKQMEGLASRKMQSASATSKNRFDRMLFGPGHPFAKQVSGTPNTINNIQLADLQKFHQAYFSGGNTILTVVSSLDSATIFTAVEKYFAEIPPTIGHITIPGIPLTTGTAVDSTKIGSRQAYLNTGYSFDLDRKDLPALTLMNQMLSDRIAFELREVKGWAYRLGSRVSNWKNRGYFNIYMGTSKKTTWPAIRGIREEVESFRNVELSEKTLQKTKNSIAAALVRRRASRENQAYVLGLNEFRHLRPAEFFKIYEMLKEVPLSEVSEMRSKYLQTHSYRLFYTIPEETTTKPGPMNGMPMKMGK